MHHRNSILTKFMKREQLKLKSIPNDTNWIEAMMEKGLDLLEVLK